MTNRRDIHQYRAEADAYDRDRLHKSGERCPRCGVTP